MELDPGKTWSLLNALLPTDPQPDLVRDGLYLGGFGSLNYVEDLQITHILSVIEMSAPLMRSALRGQGGKFDFLGEHKIIVEQDLPSTNLLKHMPEAVEWLECCRAEGGTALVHCAAGVSRSTTIVAAYLMKTEGMTRDEALSHIRSKRSCAFPNSGFMQQLQQWYADGFQASASSPIGPSPIRQGNVRSFAQPHTMHRKASHSRASDQIEQLLEEGEPVQIRAGLFLGGWRSLLTVPHLNITHILSATDTTGADSDLLVPRENRLEINVEDLPVSDLLSHLPAAVQFIKAARDGGGSVLVHCIAGVSRSPALVMAYLMQEEGLSMGEALKVVQRKRPCAGPNAGFMDQLRQWGEQGFKLVSDSPASQRKALADLAEKAMLDAGGFPSLGAQDLMPSPAEDSTHSGAAGELVYRCRTCRRVLASSSSMMPLNDSGDVGNDDSSLFVNPMKYMEHAILGVTHGKLYCPKCQAKLGAFSWVGMRNNKGQLVVPAFQLHLSRLDQMPANGLQLRYSHT